MKCLLFRAAAVILLVTSLMSFIPRTSHWVYCIDPKTSTCQVIVLGRSTVDQGLGVIGVLHCASSPTRFICPAITIYYGD